MNSKKILFIFGTRPEAIKLAPLIKEFANYSDFFTPLVCVTAQHRDLLDQVLDFFDVTPDYDLNIMQENQTLFQITSNILTKIENVINNCNPDIVVVQGDTTTAMVGALAAYYRGIPVAHVEAGLRSGDIYSPFPEEINRKFIGQIAHWHFAPTWEAKNNLLREGFTDNIFVVGNTGIDALFLCLRILEEKKDAFDNLLDLNLSEKVILLTSHRRENFGKPLENICEAITLIAQNNPDVSIIYPVHPNPNVKVIVNSKLQGFLNIHLVPPLTYPHLVWLMKKSYLILTDSGGIQEEAPALQKPVLVLREKTERVESLQSGNAKLVGHNTKTIVEEVEKLLHDSSYYQSMAKLSYVYGDGQSSRRILEHILNSYGYF